MKPSSPTPGVEIVLERNSPRPEDFGLTVPSLNLDPRLPVEHYTVNFLDIPGESYEPDGQRGFVLQYKGKIVYALGQKGEESARGFQEARGVLSPEGVYLDGGSYWYPWFNEGLMSFTIDVQVPKGWEAVSQGERTRHERKEGWTRIRWESPEPQDEIFLIGGPLTEYSQAAGTVQAMALLRTPDEVLANKYLEATGRYIEMYSKLIGPYPYKKFALVENFWETGYGMPSFTLLGSKVVRLPFILHSSYPHEILHNWWGNGVYVDYRTGNWSEGLTAYLADHLLQEQRGAAVAYRRDILQKYADYVSEGKDFPLTEFRSRHSSVTEAVGYGKTMMLFHMLRQRLGDAGFVRALRKFFQEHQFRRAAFSDLKKVFSHEAGEDLGVEFEQWVKQPGAPALRVTEARVQSKGEGYLLTAILEQVQSGPAYSLRIPVAVHILAQEKAYQTTVVMEGKRLEMSLRIPGKPVRLDVDPEFDLFRRLDINEIPAALTRAFGADRILILLPSKASVKMLKGYRQLAESWRRFQPEELEIKMDTEVKALPADSSVWLFGVGNIFRSEMEAALSHYDVSILEKGVRIGDSLMDWDTHSVVLTARHPGNPVLALTWVTVGRTAAIPGLSRKLPHYRKYSFLGFEGDEPVNMAKGEWPVVGSPLSIAVRQPDGRMIDGPSGKLSPRRGLAELSPVFSQERKGHE